MSRHDDKITLHQMLDHIDEAIILADRRNREELDSDRMFFLSLLKLVEIVCEVATRISDSFQSLHPEVPWREIIGTRNRLIHGYDAVDCDILWNIVKTDFPLLVPQIKALILL